MSHESCDCEQKLFQIFLDSLDILLGQKNPVVWLIVLYLDLIK